MKPFAIALAGALLAVPAYAVSDPAELLPDRTQELRAEAIGHQLRCLVCQNESVEESNADLARDLRRIIRQRVVAGDSDQQVIDWMVARYGDFVRLRPPFNATTLMLWGAPLIALLAGIGAALLARRRRPAAPAPLSDAERQRLADLLKS
jgi:cytochrome c-type biogenesis protein CcmH